MATVIDSLVVLLRLDPQGQFRKDSERVSQDQRKAKEQSLKSANELEDRFRKTSDVVGKVRREVVGFLTVLTAGVGLQQFAQNTIKSDAALGRLSKQINVNTEELSAWQGVLKRGGGQAEEAASGLATITKAFQDIQLTGQSPLIPYLQNLGISLKDLEDPTETLLKIADKFSKMPAPRAAALGAGFGFSPAMIATLSKGREAVAKLLEEQRALGVVTEADAQKAERAQDRLARLTAAWERLARNILYEVTPALEVVAGWLEKLGTWAQDNGPVVAAALGGVAVALGLIAAEAALAAAPVLGMAAAFAAVAAAIATLVQDYKSWESGGPSKFDWSGVSRAVDGLREAFGTLQGALKDAAGAFSELVAAIPPSWWDFLRKAVVGIAVVFTTVLKVAIDGLVTTVRVLADMLRVVAALLRGDFSEAWKQAGKVGSDLIDGWKTKLATFKDGAKNVMRVFREPNKPRETTAPTARPAAPGAPAPRGATAMIRKYEGFRANAYWDRNAWRVGYGSDTLTDPKTGKVTRVTRDTKGVTKEQAEADLQRRVRTEFEPRAANQVGEKWKALPQTTRDALTSVTYNYGSLPKNVVTAAKTGDNAKIAAAVEALQTHNAGINRERRLSEAETIRTGRTAAPVMAATAPPRSEARNIQQNAAVTQGAAANVPVAHNDNRTNTVNINGPITVSTQGRDAAQIARDLGPALRQHAFVAQANTGLG